MRAYQSIGVVVTTLGLLVACDGGDGGPSGSNRVVPTGVYSGSFNNAATGTTDTLLGLIDSNNVAVFVDQTHPAIYRLSGLLMSGSTLTASFTAFAGSGVTFPNGGTTDTGTITATVVQRSSVSGSESIGGSQSNSNFTLAYQAAQTSIPASFATLVGTSLVGTYTYPLPSASGSDTMTITINGFGTVSGTDTLGCTLTGAMGVPLSIVNIYEIDGVYVCGSTASQLAFTGMATFNPASGNQPATLDLEYDNGTDTGVFAVATEQ